MHGETVWRASVAHWPLGDFWTESLAELAYEPVVETPIQHLSLKLVPGTIPPEIAALTALQSLNLYENQLEGTLRPPKPLQ